MLEAKAGMITIKLVIQKTRELFPVVGAWRLGHFLVAKALHIHVALLSATF